MQRRHLSRRKGSRVRMHGPNNRWKFKGVKKRRISGIRSLFR